MVSCPADPHDATARVGTVYSMAQTECSGRNPSVCLPLALGSHLTTPKTAKSMPIQVSSATLPQRLFSARMLSQVLRVPMNDPVVSMILELHSSRLDSIFSNQSRNDFREELLYGAP